MAIVRPRLTDYHNIFLNQSKTDFAIPFLDEDIPLYIDPFLMWKSPSQQDNAMHVNVVNQFNHLGEMYSNDEELAISTLIKLSECEEIGLGSSKTRRGSRIGRKLAKQILETFALIPQVKSNGYSHIEHIQFVVDGISKDRISDITANFIKSYLIDYTIQKCKQYNVPTENIDIEYFENKTKMFVSENVNLPVNPDTNEAILLVPKRWLRFNTWLSPDDYFMNYLTVSNKLINGETIGRQEVLEYNRLNFDSIVEYTYSKQRLAEDCKNDPLFNQIPVLSTKRKLNSILKLDTGNKNKSDKIYEDSLTQLLATLLYPDLDFAKPQSRTLSGVLIRDLIFYNNIDDDFLNEIYKLYNSRQIVFELKNVNEVETKHINQLNRYLKTEFGRFGIIFSRHIPPNKVMKNTIDLWAGQRRCILILTDEDLKLMCQLYVSKQRKPIDVIKKKYKEFMDMCPS